MRVINGRWEKGLHQYFVWLCGALVGVAALGIAIYLFSLHQITLNVDDENFTWKTLKISVKDALTEKQIILKQGDVVHPGLETRITRDLHIDVIRSFPIQITAGGKVYQVYTVGRPVRNILNQFGIVYDVDDRISPSLDATIQPEQKIRVIRVSSSVITTRTVIKPGTEYQKDNSMEQGETKVVRIGETGVVERQIKMIYEDGREIRRYKIAEKIVKPAVNAVIVVGIKPIIRTLVTSRGTYRYRELKVMDATAYSPGPESCGKYAVYGRTYTGKKAGFGLVAVDPRVIPLGSKLYIDGYGQAEAADKGAAIKGNRIDLCYETYREAVMFGRKKIMVYILE